MVEALRRVGVAAVFEPWRGDLAEYEAAVIRGTWDYILDRPAFLDWAAAVACPLANPFDVLRWNTDKRYLRELEASGIPVVPTQWSDRPGWSLSDGPFVVKPAVSAGGRNSARYDGRSDWDAAAAHVRAIESSGDVGMIQPFVPSVDTVGETGTYVFGGEVSHAIRKGGVLVPGQAASGDLNAGSIDTVTARPVDAFLAAFAQRVLAASPGPCLYARVDTVADADGRPMLIELEVTEPYFFLRGAPDGADRFAAAVAAWLR